MTQTCFGLDPDRAVPFTRRYVRPGDASLKHHPHSILSLGGVGGGRVGGGGWVRRGLGGGGGGGGGMTTGTEPSDDQYMSYDTAHRCLVSEKRHGLWTRFSGAPFWVRLTTHRLYERGQDKPATSLCLNYLNPKP